MQRNSKGQLLTLDAPREANRDQLGPPRFGWRRLALANALTTADPGTRLASAITDSGEGAGIVFPLTGGWGSADWSGAYPYVTWSLNDLFGFPLGGSVNLAISFRVRLFTALAATDEFVIGVCLANENVLTGTTVEAKGVYMVGTGAGANLSTGNCSANNGTGTESNGTMTASVVTALGATVIMGGTASRMFGSGTIGADSSGDVVSGSGTTSLGTVTLTSVPLRWYLHAFAGRLSAGVAAAKSPAADFHIAPNLWVPLAA